MFFPPNYYTFHWSKARLTKNRQFARKLLVVCLTGIIEKYNIKLIPSIIPGRRSISLNCLGINRQFLSGRIWLITPYKVRRVLRTMGRIFDHFCAAAIGRQSGQMNILRHLPASVCSGLHEDVRMLVCFAYLDRLVGLRKGEGRREPTMAFRWAKVRPYL